MTTTTSLTPARTPRSGSARSARLVTQSGVVAGLLVFAALTSFPVLVVVLAAFSPESEVLSWPPNFIPSRLTLENFDGLMARIPVFGQSWNSFVFAAAVTGLSLVFNSLAAYALARIQFRGRIAIFTVLIAIMMVPFQALLVPLYELISEIGWVNTYAGLVIPRAADVAGIFLLRQFFITLPRDLDSAARIDGASELRVFWSVILPNAVPALLTMALFHFVNNWNDLLWPLIMTSDSSVRPLTAGLALLTGSATGVAPYGVMMAGSLVAILPLVVLYLLVQRRFIEGVAMTGMKG
ncbi:carbohydrate ABC transporter permease [Ruania halotolerans]|uniref:carbohydrate ABC transporter permease n=1 Tax=Ruania halotolerans TaxID=2897773 RepID=UPI001E51BB58|nr:carbohydrate ABC transporter permease [Ruania halotolerans]UFU05901.1 carbohydrate ABC transporter permease [Ruania halotolerans]